MILNKLEYPYGGMAVVLASLSKIASYMGGN